MAKIMIFQNSKKIEDLQISAKIDDFSCFMPKF